MYNLKIGDSIVSGQVSIKIIDEDRLCYVVGNVYKNLEWNRTVSKVIVGEFVDYLQQHPNATAEEAGNALSGKSKVDKFEYGYKATLLALAKLSIKNGYNTPPRPSTKPFQAVFYGAPGTGKSHVVRELTRGKSVIRTTFHPDSDYSTFVGAYKPTTKEAILRDLSGHIVYEKGSPVKEQKIVYEFVEQAFLQAYTKAWKEYAKAQPGETPQEQYLVIEEINRGNCAQIFGDLFQLLDRNDAGFSDYAIRADKDLQKYLEAAFAGVEFGEKYQKIKEGKELLLPKNLYIWATMNTSDQSLFPIDSAFKRRWDWTYMPITDAGQGWRIEVNGKEYDWWTFLDKVNGRIGEMTSSEDKKLGYFFCKPRVGNNIDAETFVSKVCFYLWNDVFKDYLEEKTFQAVDGSALTFDKFFGAGSHNIREENVEKFLEGLDVKPIGADAVPEESQPEGVETSPEEAE